MGETRFESVSLMHKLTFEGRNDWNLVKAEVRTPPGAV